MKSVKLRVAIAAAVGCLGAGSAIAIWQMNPQQNCTRVTMTGPLEVTYSRGCLKPQRYKRWLRST